MAPNTNNGLLTREAKAGWNPDVNNRLRVLVVGAGALGQNTMLPLALAQVGELTVVDFGQWDLSNATRSPMFGSTEERARHGNFKAPRVAESIASMTSWSARPHLRYATAFIQELPDAVFERCDILLSCVDDNRSRSYLAQQAKRHSLPMVEGGFSGFAISYGLYGPTSAEPCWRCGFTRVQTPLIAQGCDAAERRARAASQTGFIGSTQTVAGFLGNLLADAIIEYFHEHEHLLNSRIYFGDIRKPDGVSMARQPFNPDCANQHIVPERRRLDITISDGESVSSLLDELKTELSSPFIRLPSAYEVRRDCITCGRLVEVAKASWRILVHPRCVECDEEDGFPLVAEGNEPPLSVSVVGESTSPVRELSCNQVGIIGGREFHASSADGDSVSFQIRPSQEYVKVYNRPAVGE